MAQTIGPLLCRAVHTRTEPFRRQRAAALLAQNTEREDPLRESALKALRCDACGGEWVVREADLDRQLRCPFCAARTRQKPKPDDDGSLGSAICCAVERLGGVPQELDALADAMLAEAPALKKEIRIFARTVCASNGALLRRALETGSADLDALQRELVEEEGLTEAWAASLCDAVRTAAARLNGAAASVLAHVAAEDFDVGERSLAIADGMLTMGTELVAYFGSDETVAVPDGITEIRAFAFAKNGTLQTLTLPDSVHRIGCGAFQECEQLRAVSFGKGLTEIEEDAFIECGALEHIRLPDPLRRIGNCAFAFCSSLQHAELNEGLAVIGKDAFSDCVALESISIPGTVKTIGGGAFSGCSGLESIRLASGVETLEDYVFFKCEALRSVDLPDTVRSAGKCAFSFCAALERVELSDGMTELASGLFKWCETLQTVKLPAKLTCVEQEAFRGCAALETLQFSPSLVKIGAHAFTGCKKLRSITVPKTVEYDPHAFGEESWERVQPEICLLPEKGRKPVRAYETVYPEKHLTFSASKDAYSAYNTTVDTFRIPSGFTHITKLGLTPYAARMRYLEIPRTVRHIDPQAFSSCRALKTVRVEDGNPYYQIIRGALYERESGKILWSPKG